MFIVVTGLDGSGTSTIANELSKLDEGSIVLKTPSAEYAERELIDEKVKGTSCVGHFLYYLSSTVFMSDYIKQNIDFSKNNVYCVRYLIDTVVSNRVAGIDVDLDYNIYGNELLQPDLTLFVGLDEELRQERISNRGKSKLDKVLDNNDVRQRFLEEFKLLLPDETIYIDNSLPLDENVTKVYKEIKEYQEESSKPKVLSYRKKYK